MRRTNDSYRARNISVDFYFFDCGETNPVTPERLEEIVEKNQTFFNKLEFFAAQAIDNGDWESFFDFIDEPRGLKPRPRLQRVSLIEFLQTQPCTTTQTTITEAVDDEEAGTSEPTRSA